MGILIILLGLVAVGCFFLFGSSSTDKAIEEGKRLDEQRVRDQLADDLSSDFRRIGWTYWADQIKNLYLSKWEIERMQRGMNTSCMKLVAYDRKTLCAYVRGDHGTTYRIEEKCCLCPDFEKRRRPCKHIYFMLFQLIGEDPDVILQNMQNIFSSMQGWDKWDADIHKEPEQFVRMRLAAVDDRISVLCYDSTHRLAKVQDGDHVFLVSDSRCSCEDCRERQLPCKHMYALAARLNGDTEKPIPDQENLPLYGLKFVLAGHFQTKSKDHPSFQEEISALGGTCATAVSRYSSGIILGSDPSDSRRAMAEDSQLEIFTPEQVKLIFR